MERTALVELSPPACGWWEGNLGDTASLQQRTVDMQGEVGVLESVRVAKKWKNIVGSLGQKQTGGKKLI